MWRRYVIIGGTAIIVLALLAGAVFTLLSKGAPPAPSNSGGLIAQLQRSLAPRDSATHAVVTGKFAFWRLDIDTSQPIAQACLVFTRPLDETGQTRYEDYLSLSPAVKIVSRAIGSRLCLSGLDFNTTYQLTLKKGLPASDGRALAADEVVPVGLRDKPALVRFSGGIMLPRDNAEGVPVTTVNVSRLSLKLIRVSDRLLSQIESGLIDRNTLYSWDTHQLENNQGQVVWSGGMDIAGARNAMTVTLIPFTKMLAQRKPGAYMLVAQDASKAASDDADGSGEMAVQWVIDSDIALTTFNAGTGKNAGGMSVFTRSYANALPKRGVHLKLIARDNTILGEAESDSVGRADFDAGLFRGPGGAEPVAVMAYDSDGDFSFLDLRRPSFDLTDRGVGGRDVAGPADAYLYSDRGVYRPGEHVHVVAMLRDRLGIAIAAPLTLNLQRPDGITVASTTFADNALKAGGGEWSPRLNTHAPHGRWQIAAYIDPKADPIGRVTFDVADFVPQLLDVTLRPEQTLLHPQSPIAVHVAARFLYGAVASSLGGDGEARIQADPTPFPAYAPYQFGRIDDAFAPVVVPLSMPLTDAAGMTLASGTVGTLAETTLPLKAAIRVSIHEPGGRTSDKTIDIRIATHDIALGIRPDFDNGVVAQGAPARFSLIALDQQGQRIAVHGLDYSWVREETNYQWYQDNGQWKFQSITRDHLIASGQFDIAAGAPARLANQMPWGTYCLTISDPISGAASSYRFYSGWAATASAERPDRIPVAADKPSYKTGELAKITFKAQADGQALVVVAGEKVFSSQVVAAPAGTNTVMVPVSPEWGAGAYVLITTYRPLNQSSAREPVRAIGLTWLTLDHGEQTLTPLIAGPKLVRPGGKIILPVTVQGLSSGERAYLTLAAVDEGILQLTAFASPDPAAYFYGKRKLGIGMRDDYGRLILPEKAPIGALRTGGDSLGGRQLSVVPQKTVALFSGLVDVDAHHRAQIPLDLPDFNGQLRLMAVAWSANKTGAASQPLTVRDPVVADLVLPRFLAPGDRAEAALTLDNVEGAAGSYMATITVSGPLALDAGAAQSVVTKTLNRGERALLPVVLSAHGIGVGTMTLTLRGPAHFARTRSWSIESRSPQLDITRSEIAVMKPGARYVANAALLDGLVPQTALVSINVSATRGFGNVAGLLRWLDQYPYGCAEQISARAMPLLYFNSLAAMAGLPGDTSLHERIQNAADSLVDMQTPIGDFGMWGPGYPAQSWISVFALDFLVQAKAAGYVVADEPLQRGMSWLQRLASNRGDDAVRAYAFYVLARDGRESLSDLRYFADTEIGHMKTIIAAALTGAAAAEAGDRSRTAYAFQRAADLAQKAVPSAYPDDNAGSYIRDLAATIGLAVDSGEGEIVPGLMAKVSPTDLRLNATTTQDKAWILRAAYALSKQRLPLSVRIDDQPAQAQMGAVRLSPTPAALAHGIAIVNAGNGAVWREVSVEGSSSQPLPAASDGVRLSKTLWTLDGMPADLAHLKQNDRIVVVISGQMANSLFRRMALTDLLPAGLEIETVLTGEAAKAYAFIGPLSPTDMSEARDDRLVAAFSIGARDHPAKPKAQDPPPVFRLAYIARAVTAGRFILPAANAADMYAPAIAARTEMGKITIGASR